jgi:5-(carboxyamino)imidazole ribonucleotide mutase
VWSVKGPSEVSGLPRDGRHASLTSHSTLTRVPYNREMSEMGSAPLVGVVMGSKSDYEVMVAAVEVLREFGVAHEVKVVSAHRTPDLLFEYAATAQGRGLRAIVAGAGGAAHLPGMLAAKTLVPVLGVPVPATALQGMDALLSIVQMPKGVPVATFAIGRAGAANAGLFAVEMLAVTDAALSEKLATWRAARTADVLAQELPQ